MRGCFVTGTDTGAGKSVVAAAICAALASRGVAVRAHKPVVTGLDEPAAGGWPHDHVLLAAAAGMEDPAEVAPLRHGPAVSPHLAAELAGEPIDPAAVVARVRAAGARGEALVVEGVGGLLVPLTTGFSVRDLAGALALPLVVAARPGLGTINHTLLTLEAARAAGLRVAGVVLTPWPPSAGRVERSNRATLARLGATEVATLAHVPRPQAAALAAAGRVLPLERWLAPALGAGDALRPDAEGLLDRAARPAAA